MVSDAFLRSLNKPGLSWVMTIGTTIAMGMSTFHLKFINEKQKVKIELLLIRMGFNPINTNLNPDLNEFNPEKYL